jgi:hypothetical protein
LISIPRKPAWLSSLKAAQVKRVQRQLNEFTHKHTLGIAPLIVDGRNGQHTRTRVRLCKYLLGWKGKRTPQVTRRMMRQLEHPNWLIFSTPARIVRGNHRRAAERRHWKANHAAASAAGGVTHYDGVPVAAVAVPILNWCREHGWKGRLVSGWRDPAYSESLCRRMCGAPRCPGLCAGTSSNHVGTSAQRFAVDVSDYATFRRVVAQCPLSPHIHNSLPRDLVHFSPSGG